MRRPSSIHTLPRSQQPRTRFLSVGVDNMTTTELCALLLGNGTRKAGVLTLAQRLAHFCKQKPHKLTLTELSALGLGAVQVSRVLSAFELSRRLNTPSPPHAILKPDDVLREAEAIRHSHREHTMGLYLNARYELLKKQILTIGSVNSNAIEARDVFAPALTLPCRSLILIHNHPSGTTQPSQEDVATTHRLRKAGELLGVTLLDHVIVTSQGYCSLQQEKLL